MGLLDKAAASGGEEAKPVAKAKTVAKAKPVAKAAAKAKTVKTQKPAKAKKARAPRARPVGLADDYELATTMNRRITWLVNFIINFGVLFAAIFISMSDTGITTILYAVSAGIIILNGISSQ